MLQDGVNVVVHLAPAPVEARVCAGPRAWDLACLRSTSRLDGRAALDALPDAPTDAELAPWLELRRLHAAAWTLVAAAGHPELRLAATERLAAAAPSRVPP